MADTTKKPVLALAVIAVVATAGLVAPGRIAVEQQGLVMPVPLPVVAPAPPPPPPLSAQEISDRTRAITVTIATELGLLGVAGTGIVLTPDGQVLTNYHVIAGAQDIKITHIGNGLIYDVDVIGYDKPHDLALLKMQSAEDLVPATLGSSANVAVGAPVTAIGNAGGTGALTEAPGMVTDLDKSITAVSSIDGTRNRLSGLIEVDADVRAGDSGGPLVDAYGSVVGVDAAGLSDEARTATTTSGPRAPEAYAIPMDAARGIVDQIRSGTPSGTVHVGPTAFLGVSVTESPGGGARVVTVDSRSPASTIDIAAGDAITDFGGIAISTPDDLKNQMNVRSPGDTVSLTWRTQSGEIRSGSVTLDTGTPVG